PPRGNSDSADNPPPTILIATPVTRPIISASSRWENLRIGCGEVMWGTRMSCPSFNSPTAGITIPEFDEIDRALQLLPPHARLDLCLCRIDLQERPRQDYREERVVAQAQIAVERPPQVELPNQRYRHLSPYLHQSR